jgi:hypothetical protein
MHPYIEINSGISIEKLHRRDAEIDLKDLEDSTNQSDYKNQVICKGWISLKPFQYFPSCLSGKPCSHMGSPESTGTRTVS